MVFKRTLDKHNGSNNNFLDLQKSLPDKLDVMYCFLEASSREAVEVNHAKLGCICDWITEVKTAA